MKKISNKRLTLDRETVKTLAGRLSHGQLEQVNGGVQSSSPGCGCCSSGHFTNISLEC